MNTVIKEPSQFRMFFDIRGEERWLEYHQVQRIPCFQYLTKRHYALNMNMSSYEHMIDVYINNCYNLNYSIENYRDFENLGILDKMTDHVNELESREYMEKYYEEHEFTPKYISFSYFNQIEIYVPIGKINKKYKKIWERINHYKDYGFIMQGYDIRIHMTVGEYYRYIYYLMSTRNYHIEDKVAMLLRDNEGCDEE